MIATWTRRAGVLAAALMLLPAALAQADSSTQLSVIGTSDVSDSGLFQNLIQPQFHSEFPQFTFTYTGSATGKAIQNAEQGIGTPSVADRPRPFAGEPVRRRRLLAQQPVRKRDLHQRLRVRRAHG